MSLRSILVVGVLVLGCGSPSVSSDEPTTAKEKQAREAEASGDDGGKNWGAWRYSGDRDDCFFVVGKRCFKTEKAACAAVKCKAPNQCQTVGGGPAAVSCTE